MMASWNNEGTGSARSCLGLIDYEVQLSIHSAMVPECRPDHRRAGTRLFELLPFNWFRSALD